MKIDKPVSAPVDFQKMAQQKKAAAPKVSPESKEPSRSSSPGAVDRVLNKVVDDIQKSGLSAGEMHSSVDEARVSGFLRSMEAQSKQPQMSEDDLMALADKVSQVQQENPQAASDAFNSLDPHRVQELL